MEDINFLSHQANENHDDMNDVVSNVLNEIDNNQDTLHNELKVIMKEISDF